MKIKRSILLDIPSEDLGTLYEQLTTLETDEQLRRSTPPVFSPFDQPSRYKGAHGGRGSAKSWSFAKNVLRRCIRKPGTRVVCIREVQRSLAQSVKRLLEDTIKRHDLGSRFDVGVHKIGTPGGGVIIFQGMQDHTAESIKSLEGFDIAWVEEAQALSARSLTLLRPTLRKDDSELWFTWNPRRPSDPVDALLRGKDKPPDAIVVQANYRDNPFLPQVLKAELEWDMKRDPDKYEHVWLGGYVKNSEARVFKNWRVEDVETPRYVSFLFGGDWGFATDPDVLVRGWVDGQSLYIDQEAYQVGCEIDDTPALFDSVGCQKDHVHDILVDRKFRLKRKDDERCDGMAREWRIVTDSARPETISYMQRHGYPKVIGAKKGPNSIEEGIKFLKNYDIVIHPRCVHTIDEFTMYSFQTDKLTGLIIPVLQTKKNHVIDSARYMVEPLRQPIKDNTVVW